VRISSIPGAYAIGELIGRLFYSGAVPGSVFGKIAGTSAAKVDLLQLPAVDGRQPVDFAGASL
jgi:hypothetical protein